MADIRPFHGLRYNLEIVGDLSTVITPPYDVITPEQQYSYHQRSPYNIIRLEFGEELPNDVSGNKYSRAANTLNEWLRKSILVREKHPAFYLTEHRFPYKDGLQSYWGLIAAVRLEDLRAGRIRLTEITMKEPALDRLSLLKACRANFCPIMGIFNQGEGSLLPLFQDVTLDSPSLAGVDDSGVTFNVWIVTEKETIRKVSEFFANKVLYIADGHHRYEVAKAYRDEQLVVHPDSSGDEAFNFVMMTLIDSRDPGLAMLPVHRLVRGIDPDGIAKLGGRLADYFQIQELIPSSSGASEGLHDWMAALNEAGNRGVAFGLYGLSPRKFHLLTPRDVLTLHNMLPEDKPMPWRELDVSLLHWVILREMLGIDSPEKGKECLEYSPDESEVLRKVDAGISPLAFLLNPVPVSSVLAVADAGVRMPPKSTYFYPKTPAGLVINPLW